MSINGNEFFWFVYLLFAEFKGKCKRKSAAFPPKRPNNKKRGKNI